MSRDLDRLWRDHLPPEKSIRIVPLFRAVEIQTFQPARFTAPGRNGRTEAFEDRRDAGHALIGEEARERVRRPPIRSLQVALLVRIEVPRDELAECDPAAFRNGQN